MQQRGQGGGGGGWEQELAALASTQGMLHAGATQQACGSQPRDGGAGSSLRYPLGGGGGSTEGI